MSIEYSVYGDVGKRLKNDFFNTTVSSPTNDLIFTKPDAVKIVLDAIEKNDPDAFNSVTRTYCDIASKSGAFLIGIAERIFNSAEAKRIFPDPYLRVRHIYQYQIFGLTSNLLCWGTIYQRVYRIYAEEYGKEIIEPFCKLNILNVERLNDTTKFDEEEVLEMFRVKSNFSKEATVNEWGEVDITEAASDRKFDYIISNPPYQISKGGTKNIDVWYHFDEKATKIADKVCMIHPGRWVVPKKNMTKVRDMLIDSGLEWFDYYSNSDEIFKGTSIGGGLSITFFNNNKTDIRYSANGGNYKRYSIDEVVLSDDFEVEVYEKITNIFDNKIGTRIKGSVGSLNSDEFGYKKDTHAQFLCETAEGMNNPFKVWGTKDLGKGCKNEWFYIEKESLSKNVDKITNARKVMLSKAGNSISDSSANIINNKIQIVDAKSTGTNIFFIFPEIDDDYHLNLIKSYFETKTVRFLMSITQKDLYVRGFENVPDYTYFIDELNGELFTDKFFYDKFNFSQELIDHIEKSISAK